MITAFGKFCRVLRIEHNELLKDMADKLGVTSAYLSAVEVGKRNIPAEWVSEISNVYELSEEKKLQLQDAVDQSVMQVKIDLQRSNEQQKQVAVMFARRLDNLSKDELSSLFKIIKGE